MGCEGLILLLSPAGVRAGESPGVEGGGWGVEGGVEKARPLTPKLIGWCLNPPSPPPSFVS